MRNCIIIGIAFFIFSCTGYEYVPSPHYVPLNTEKGELNARVACTSYQLGYSFADHFSFFTTGKLRDNTDYKLFKFLSSMGDFSNSLNYGHHSYADNTSEFNVGVSYFNKYKLGCYEILLGGGYGELEYKHTIDFANEYDFTMRCNRLNFFIQPNAGIHISDYLEAGISAKLSGYICYDTKTTLVPGDNQDDIRSDNYFIGKRNATMYFFEPGITFRGGLKYFKAQTQIVPVFNLTSNQIRYRAFSWFLSFSMNLKVLKIIENSKHQEMAHCQF